MVLDMKVPEKKKGFFSKKAPPAPMGPDPALLNDIATLTRRLRVLEEQYTNTRRRISVMDENMLSYGKKQTEGASTVNSELTELRKMIEDLDDKLVLVIKELKRSARKEDVEVLNKYINMWQPVNFVTREEVERIVKDFLEQKQKVL
jgi:hypothetical protein